MTLGANLRRLRDEAGISRAALARKSGTSHATIARTELYGHTPHLHTVQALAAALGVSIDDLLDTEQVA